MCPEGKPLSHLPASVLKLRTVFQPGLVEHTFNSNFEKNQLLEPQQGELGCEALDPRVPPVLSALCESV